MKTYPTIADKTAIEVFEVTAGCQVWSEEHGWCLAVAGGGFFAFDEQITLSLYGHQIQAIDLDDEVTIDTLREQLDDPDVVLDMDIHDLRRFF